MAGVNINIDNTKQKNLDEQTINHLNDHEKKWFAIYTKFRAEKFVAQVLNSKNIDCYLPLKPITKKYARKIVHREIPLINCYLFVQIYKNQYTQTLDTPHVIKFIKQGKDLISIPQEEINIIKRICGEFIDIELAEKPIVVGQKVEIASGPLAGIKGYVLEKLGKRNFYVELETIGIHLRMIIEHQNLYPLSSNQ